MDDGVFWDNYSFVVHCRFGRLEEAKALFATNNITRIDSALHDACRNGHFKTVLWLLSISNPKEPTLIFQRACFNNHFEIAKYLYSIFIIDIYKGDHRALKCVYSRNYMEIGKWLFSLYKQDNVESDIEAYVFFDFYIKKQKLNFIDFMLCIQEYTYDPMYDDNIFLIEVFDYLFY